MTYYLIQQVFSFFWNPSKTISFDVSDVPAPRGPADLGA